ncbi:methyltransferase domain protein (macronuclear) [Tetrahymena thermophila SB210]|uniref:Methyltransferase domain protein n=1 Tax=Tetrahymena thermophila (strain SB210) TaxID=312017 RepID=I7LTA0_TETTS|nr:methyltransferase domain protein [Tetrahymena thermophila SB210]EAR84868.1 methyltransferase domain protein [Tetrahymena thermophila SB210]|eukprot:XP_001032531.1 methyltransferase domain protein [Tetrahymena thermophila SB210]
MPNYGTKNYWEKRYKKQKNTVFEWLENYQDLKEIINESCQKDGIILNLGCGNSVIQEEMYDDGYKNIYNIDISEECIKQMDSRKGNRPELIYEVMDCTELKYEDEKFDFVIDKSTIDALLCGDYSYLNVAKMMSEVQRVLKPNGVYLIVSYGEPYNRTFHFERNHIDFTYTVKALPPKGTSKQDFQNQYKAIKNFEFQYIKYYLNTILKFIILICFYFLNALDAQDGSGQKQNPHYAYILKKGPNAQQKYENNYEEVILELIEEEKEALKLYGASKDQDSGDEDSQSDEEKQLEEGEDSQEECEDKQLSSQQNTDDQSKEEEINELKLESFETKDKQQDERECKNLEIGNEQKFEELKLN